MRGTYDTPKRDHVIKTRLDDDEYEFFFTEVQGLWDESIGNDPRVFGQARHQPRDQILPGEQGASFQN